jgi:hypothetical protein
VQLVYVVRVDGVSLCLEWIVFPLGRVDHVNRTLQLRQRDVLKGQGQLDYDPRPRGLVRLYSHCWPFT